MADMVTHDIPHEVRIPAEVAGGGSLAEAVVGAGAVILAVLGLVGMYSMWLAAIATIAIGASFLLGAGATTLEVSRLLSGESTRTARAEIAGGATAEFFAGGAGVILGVLALLGRLPLTMIPVAAIIFGGALLLTSGAMARLNALLIHAPERHEKAERIVREVLYGAVGADVLVGLGGVVLGILALAGYDPLTLSLVAMLAFGATVLINAGAVAGRLFAVITR